MPINVGGATASGGPWFNADIDPAADIDPTKLAYTSMGTVLRKLTVQSVSTATLTPVNFTDADAVDAVPSGYTQLHDPSSNPSRIILRQKGFWQVSGVLAYAAASGTTSFRYCYVTKNGSTLVAPWLYTYIASLPYGVQFSTTLYTSLNTEYVEMQAYHDQPAASVNVGDYGGGTWFSAAFLGDIT